MTPPFFSIAIPTRNRSSLARKSVEHVLSQDFSDFELFVLDNSDKNELLTSDFADSRCVVLPSDAVLPMRDNWERALSVATGTFVMLLSDKDMLLPGALSRIAAAIQAMGASMVSYRKACFSPSGAFQSFVQQCTGRLVEKSGSDVLRAWFEEVRHFHDGPMAYNSAVRRDVLVELRGLNGRFFTGTAPDVGSGLVLMAHLGRYHLLDRPLVVSWYGDWSIGMAAAQGERGAAAAFFAEYRDDPIRCAGLVPGLTGSVAETILECKRTFAPLFLAYHFNWSSYVRNVLYELNRREIAGADVSSELGFLLDTRDRRYSRISLVVTQLRLKWERVSQAFRFRDGLKNRVRNSLGKASSSAMTRAASAPLDTSPSSTALQDIDSYFRTLRINSPDFRDVPYYPLPWATNVEDVELFASRVNSRLDDAPISI